MLRTIVEACAEVEGGYDQERAARILANGIAVRVSANASTVHAITKQHLNGEKLMNDTGFHPADNFVETLKETINFYRDYFLASSVETKNEQRLAG